MTTPLAPSPIPPWARSVQSALEQLITGADTIDLGVDCSYLNQTNQQADEAPYELVMPDGNYVRQIKRIFVLGSTQPTTAPFRLTGTFVFGTSLIFNSAATSAILEWDGTAWQMIGGNAQPQS